MNRSLFFSSTPCPPLWRVFEYDGFIDEKLISRFARAHLGIRVEVRATFSMPNGCYETKQLSDQESRLAREAERYIIARFNMSSTLASPAPRGTFPGDEYPDFFTRVIFDQDVYPICVSFRENDCDPGLACLFFNKKEGKIEGRIQEGDAPSLIQIRALIDGLRLVAPGVSFSAQ